MKLTPPQVGRLLARPRAWAWVHVRAGDFGSVHRTGGNGRTWCVDLAGVENFAGGKFTDGQILAAVNPGCAIPAISAADNLLENFHHD
jgi:hypothetical protein